MPAGPTNPKQRRRVPHVRRIARLRREYEVLFALAMTTDMRPSEYLALTWSDFDLERGAVSVSKTLQRRERRSFFEDTKRERSRRTIKLQSWVIALVRSLKEKAIAAGAKANDLVFTSERAGPIHEAKLVERHFRPLLVSAGLPNIRLYDLRHTAATLALAAGVSPKVVSEQLGHASVAFTLEVYSHVLPHKQDEAAMKVEALLMTA